MNCLKNNIVYKFIINLNFVLCLLVGMTACGQGTTTQSNDYANSSEFISESTDDSSVERVSQTSGGQGIVTTSFLTSVIAGKDAANKDMFVAVGGDSTVITSLDGKTWSKAANTSQIKTHLTAITYGTPIENYLVWGNRFTDYSTNIFVAVGLGGEIYVSHDGQNWEPSNNVASSSHNADLRGVNYGVVNGIGSFITVGSNGTILLSDDYGNSWKSVESSATSNTLFAVTSSNLGQFVAVGAHGTIVTSFDGQTWSAASSSTDKSLYAVTYDYATQTFVAVGEGGVIVTSQDGSNWTVKESNTTDNLTNIGYSYGLLVATSAGNGGEVVTSYDGTTWTVKHQAASDGVGLYGIASDAAGRIVTVGENGMTLTSDPAMNYEFNQVNNNEAVSGNLQDTIYTGSDVGAEQFMLVGDSGLYKYSYIASSSSGQINQLNNTPGLSAIALGDGVVAAVGKSGVIVSSTDGGYTWVKRDSGTTLDLKHIAYISSGTYIGFVAGGGNENTNDGVMLYSPDGVTWMPINDDRSDSNLNSILPAGSASIKNVFGLVSNGSYVVTLAAEASLGKSFSSFVSGDPYNTGSIWNFFGGTFPTVAKVSLNSMFYGLSQFIAVGDDGAIFTTSNGYPSISNPDTSWGQSQVSNTNSQLNKGTMVGDHTLLVIGDQGFTISDNAKFWSPQMHNMQHLNGVACNLNDLCVTVGDSGRIGVTTFESQSVNLH